MYVVPEELVRVAQACVDLAVDLNASVTDAAVDLVVASRDAGNTQGGYDAAAAHPPVVEAAHSAVQALAAVFEADTDALMLCAFAYSGTDEANAQGLEYEPKQGPTTLPTPPPSDPGPTWPNGPEPTPTPSPEPGPAPTPTPAG